MATVEGRFKQANLYLGTINGLKILTHSFIESIRNNQDVSNNIQRVGGFLKQIRENLIHFNNCIQYNHDEIREFDEMSRRIMLFLNENKPNDAIDNFNLHSTSLINNLNKKLERFYNTHVRPVTAIATTIHPNDRLSAISSSPPHHPLHTRGVFFYPNLFHESIPETSAYFDLQWYPPY
jgi:hypothetical protein